MPNSKKPACKWTEFIIDPNTASEFFGNGKGVALKLGQEFGEIVDEDMSRVHIVHDEMVAVNGDCRALSLLTDIGQLREPHRLSSSVPLSVNCSSPIFCRTNTDHYPVQWLFSWL